MSRDLARRDAAQEDDTAIVLKSGGNVSMKEVTTSILR